MMTGDNGDGDGDDGDDGDHLQLRETFLCWLTVRNIEVGEREGRHANSPRLPGFQSQIIKVLIADKYFCFIFYPLSLGLNLWWAGWQKLHGSKLRFVVIYALFGDLWAKKVPFWVKNSVSLERSALLHGIYCIFH